MRLVHPARRTALRSVYAGAALAALATVAACGGGDERSVGTLEWVETPKVYRQASLPRDRVLRGTLRNRSLQRITVESRDLKLVDAEDRSVAGSPVFLGAFVRGLYPPTRPPPGGLPFAERQRLGRVSRIEPGKTVPFTVSWREPPGASPPVRIEYGSGSLPIPRKASDG